MVLTRVRAQNINLALYPSGHLLRDEYCCWSNWLRICPKSAPSEFRKYSCQYKTFQLGDILANLAGSSIGLYAAYHVERQYRANREIEPLYAPLGTSMRQDEDAYEVNDWDASSVDHAPERSNGAWLDEPYENAPGQVGTESVFQLDDDEIDN